MKSLINILLSIAAVFSTLTLVTCDMASDFETPYEDYFVKYFGGDGKQTGVDMVVNSDGTVVMVGNSEIGTSSRIFFVKVDLKGNILAQATLGSSAENVKDIEPTDDGNYIILSELLKSPTNVDVKLIKVSPDGVKQDSVEFGYPEPFGDFPHSVTTLAASAGFVVAGRTENLTPRVGDASDPDPGDIFLFRFNNQLDTLPKATWEREQADPELNGAVKYFEADNGYGNCIAYTQDNRHLTNPDGNKVLFYLKVPSSGLKDNIDNYTPLDPTINGFDTEISSAARLPYNEGFVVTGTTSTGAGTRELFFCKMGNNWWPNGEPANAPRREVEIYTTLVPEGSQGLAGVNASAVQVGPRGYLVAGNDLRESGTTNIWVSKLDLLGQVNWSASFGSDSGNDTAGAVAELPDGRILVLGTMELEANMTRMVLIKMNANGKLLK